MTSTHTFFCCETDCGAEAPVYGGRCYLCSCAEKWREASEGLHTCEKRGKESCIPCAFNSPLQEENNPTRCDHCHERINYTDGFAVYCHSGVFCGKWCEAGYALANKHTCSGEFDYDRGCYVCDDHDDPLCPSNKSESQVKHCADCGVQRQETEPVLQCDWYCPPCWKVRFAPKKCCTDCGSVPKDGFFPCYRGEEPLCASCEEAAYGPPSPVDWRERTGRCSKCDFFYELHCSSDSRDLCYKCQ